MTQPTLVTGGTGTLGRRVVARLRQAGRPVRILSRRDSASEDSASGDSAAGESVEYVVGDLVAGTGLEPAVAGVDAIVHCATNNTDDSDIAATGNLTRAAARAGTPHVLYISIAGVDRIPVVSRIDRILFGYFATKLAAERVVADCGLPWTTLRATQFHHLAQAAARAMAKSPVVPVPAGWQFQPVDTDEVADRLVELALAEPAGKVADMGGPKVYDAVGMFRTYLRVTGKRRLVVPVRVPGKASRAVRDGAALAPGGTTGKRTWEEFLGSR